jgi:hypothetical protein
VVALFFSPVVALFFSPVVALFFSPVVALFFSPVVALFFSPVVALFFGAGYSLGQAILWGRLFFGVGTLALPLGFYHNLFRIAISLAKVNTKL